MGRILQLRIFIASLLGLLSCLFVYASTSHLNDALLDSKIGYSEAVMDLIFYQKYTFLVPVLGFVTALIPCKKRTRFFLLIPDLLYLFAFVWVLFASFIRLALFSARIGFFVH
jgi:hypothetical protein